MENRDMVSKNWSTSRYCCYKIIVCISMSAALFFSSCIFSSCKLPDAINSDTQARIFRETEGSLPVLVLKPAIESYNLEPVLTYYQDTAGKLTFSDIQNKIEQPETNIFKTLPESKNSFGLTDSVFWVMFMVHNPTENKQTYVLELDYPLMNHITAYIPEYTVPGEAGSSPSQNYSFQNGSYRKIESGAVIPFNQRRFSNRTYLFQVDFAPGETRGLFFRLQTDGTMRFPFYLWSPDQLLRKNNIEYAVYGLYFSFLLLSGLSSLLFFMFQKEKTFLFFFLLLTTYACFEAFQTGFHINGLSIYQLPAPMRGYIFFGSMSITWITLFCGSYLQLKTLYPFLWKLLVATAATTIFTALLSMVITPVIMIKALSTLAIIAILINIGTTLYNAKNGELHVKIFLASFLFLMIMILIFIIRGWGLLPSTYITLYGKEFSTVIMIVIIMVGIMVRVNVIKKEAAEAHDLRQERKMQQSQKLESLGLLAGGIAHDFNNLLMGIMGNIDLALMAMQNNTIDVEREIVPDDQTKGPLYEAINEAKKITKQAALLTDQILAYSGRSFFTKKHIHLSSLIENMESLLKASVSKQVELIFKLEKEIPCVWVDPGQVQQVMMNLVINASEACTAEGCPSEECIVEITTGTQLLKNEELKKNRVIYHDQDSKEKHNHTTAGDYVYVRVKDNGIGLDKEVKSKIFDPFFTTKFTGRGLGMSVVHGIVKAHKGAILLASIKNKGTTVTIFLPLEAVKKETITESNGDNKTEMSSRQDVRNEQDIPRGQHAPSRQHAPREAAESYIEQSGPAELEDKRHKNYWVQNIVSSHAEKDKTTAKAATVLVVDDDPAVLHVAAKMVEKVGFSVQKAASGREAVALYKKERDHIECVLLDLTMPGEHGKDIFLQLRKINPQVKVILASGYDVDMSLKSFDEIKPSAFMQKPYNIKDLMNVLREVVGFGEA